MDILIEPITTMMNESLKCVFSTSGIQRGFGYPSLEKLKNLPFLSEVLEKIALKQQKDPLMRNNLKEEYQPSYHGYHNIETALLRMYNDLLW